MPHGIFSHSYSNNLTESVHYDITTPVTSQHSLVCYRGPISLEYWQLLMPHQQWYPKAAILDPTDITSVVHGYPLCWLAAVGLSTSFIRPAPLVMSLPAMHLPVMSLVLWSHHIHRGAICPYSTKPLITSPAVMLMPQGSDVGPYWILTMESYRGHIMHPAWATFAPRCSHWGCLAAVGPHAQFIGLAPPVMSLSWQSQSPLFFFMDFYHIHHVLQVLLT